MAYLLESGYKSDVEFLVGNETTGTELIKAHQCVLGTFSVFVAQFRANEANGLPSDEPIKVIDITPSAFKAMLMFIYSDDLSGIDNTNIAGVLAAAKKYLLTAFDKKCVELAFELLGVENALGLLKVAEFHQEKVLADHCWAFVDQEIEGIFASNEFLSLSQGEIKELFERDTLFCDELALFQGLDLWAHKQCRDQNIENPTGEQKRAAMGSALEAIRFSLISAEDFNNKIALTNIFTGNELAANLVAFSDKGHSNSLNKWNAKNCGPQLKISRIGLEIKVKHSSQYKFGCVRAVLPIPKFNSNTRSIAYFEVEFLVKKTNNVSVGFCTQQFPLDSNCNQEDSIEICSNRRILIDGYFYEFEDDHFHTGDVVGVGIVQAWANSPLKCFVTCNGKLLRMVRLPAKFAELELLPMVRSGGDISIRTNFGQNEWRFDPNEYWPE